MSQLIQGLLSSLTGGGGESSGKKKEPLGPVPQLTSLQNVINANNATNEYDADQIASGQGLTASSPSSSTPTAALPSNGSQPTYTPGWDSIENFFAGVCPSCCGGTGGGCECGVRQGLRKRERERERERDG